jgi:hypothetical protein
MKFSLWRDFGALNSKPVFDAFEAGVKSLGHTAVKNSHDADVHVIWSVLWHGRMQQNQKIWHSAKATNKPVIVLEVGGIKRGTTWKVGLNGINRDAYFGPVGNNSDRSVLLGLQITPQKTNGEFILIAGQHERSLQWQGQPRMSKWFLKTYDEIRKYTDRTIVFRPHPRCRLEHIERGLRNVYRQEPRKLPGTYDDYDMKFDNIWATVNWSSNPGIHSVIQGVPAFVGPNSLAYDVANTDLANIENPLMPDRQQWLNDYAWTEFTLEEIANALPLSRIIDRLTYNQT